MKRLFLFAALLPWLSACSDEHAEKRLASDGNEAPAYMLYSPNGEPLNGGPLGRPSCRQALSGWFDRVSAGSGALSNAAFLEDAKAQFTRMDIDHNGYLVSEELDRFRAPYRQPQDTPKASEKQNRRKKKGKEDYGHSDPSLSMSDPVMSADANLDFKVTPDEFLKQAQDNFARLDSGHTGVITRAEALTLCDKKEP